MCQYCLQSPVPRESRRSFLRRFTCAAATTGLLGTAALSRAQMMPTNGVAEVGWARMMTPNQFWDFHADREAHEIEFLRGIPQLKFNVRRTVVSPASLADLCRAPFVYTLDMASIGVAEHWVNIREYLFRGGFLYLESCIKVSPDVPAFRRDHLMRLTRLLPASEWRRLSPEHPIYRSLFPIKPTDLPLDDKSPEGKTPEIYGVFDDNRMVSVVSIAHLFCGWPEQPEHVDAMMKMIANIYHYSRTH